MSSRIAGTRSSLTDMRVLVLLYLSYRFMMLLAYQPILTEDGETGIGAGGDRQFHYRLAELADDGRLPFRDWWSEFPPIWPAISTGVYLLLGENVNYTGWSFVLGMLLLAFEVGNLLLVRAIGCLLHGESTGTNLAWIYAISVAPAIFMWWEFRQYDEFLFLARHLLFDEAAGAAGGVGNSCRHLGKVPARAGIRGADSLSTDKSDHALRDHLCFCGGCGLSSAVCHQSQFDVLLLASAGRKAKFADDLGVARREFLDWQHWTCRRPLAGAGHSIENGVGNAATIPNWLRLAIAAGVGMSIFVTTRRTDERGLIAFVGITLLVFYLQAQAWSAQWVTLIIPLTLLVFPNVRGVLVTIVLSLLAFAEYPVLWSRTGDVEPPGQMGGEWFVPWVLIVLVRTGLLATLAMAFYKVLREQSATTDNSEQMTQ